MMRGMVDTKLDQARLPGGAGIAPFWRATGRPFQFDLYDVAVIVVLTALVGIATLTFNDYAISNDEPVQHHYGELIISYYASGFRDQSLFNFDNLYLYGGLFDVVAVLLSHLVPIDP